MYRTATKYVNINFIITLKSADISKNIKFHSIVIPICKYEKCMNN